MPPRQPEISLQAKTHLLKLYYDMAGQCADKCIANHDGKDLNLGERECVENCFQKQQNIWSSVASTATQL